MALSVNAQFEKLRLMIEHDGDSVYRASLEEMDDKADELVFQIQKNTPVDKYNLENAVYRTGAKEKGVTRKLRDPSTGRFMPYKVEIGIKDTVFDKESGKEVNVKQYALIMEESDRAGHGNVAANEAKRAAGGDPGRKFIERAYDTVEPTIVPAMIRKAKASI